MGGFLSRLLFALSLSPVKLAAVLAVLKALQWIINYIKRSEKEASEIHVAYDLVDSSSDPPSLEPPSEKSEAKIESGISPLQRLVEKAQTHEICVVKHGQQRDEKQPCEKGESESKRVISLEACDFRDFVEAHQRDYFKGSRSWLFEDIKRWVSSSEQRRLCWLVGDAGTGKSVASAQLFAVEGVREYIKAWHFCRHDNAAGSSVRVILQSWAAMLTVGLPGFEVADVGKALSASTPQEMFRLLIADPLRSLVEQKSSDDSTFAFAPCVIVLDAVDELPRGSADDLLRLLAEEFDKLPRFVRLLVAGRDAAGNRLKHFEQVKLEVDEVRNRADLRIYLTQVALRHVTLELSTADLETRLEREFGLPMFCLQDVLKGVENSFRRCKNIYAVAVSKLEKDVHYKDLCKIRELGTRSLRQCRNDLNGLYIDAAEAHDKLKSHLLQFLDAKSLADPGLKTRDSAGRKISNDCGGDASCVKDLVRFMAIFHEYSQIKQFLSRLEEAPGVSVLSLKNKFSNPSALGHRDINLTLGVPLASGRVHLCELQVTLEDMFQAGRMTHFIYEQIRVEVFEACTRAGVKDVEGFKASLAKMLRSSVLDAAVNELENKAEGLFLYAGLLARHLESMKHKVKFTDLQGLPSGLSEIYETNFGRIVQSQARWTVYSQLITLIIAAREPLPVVLARELVGPGCYEMEQALSLLFPVREGRFQVMHKSVADWLQDRKPKSLYTISKEDIKTAHSRMGLYFMQSLGAKPSGEMRAFCIRHVVYHLCLAELWDQAYKAITNVEWLLARTEMHSLGAVFDLELAAGFAASPHQPTIRLMGLALRMDLHELRLDHRSLPGRLVGRLIGHESGEVQELLNELRKWPGPPEGWWCPMQPTLLPAGGPLLTVCYFPGMTRSVQWSPGESNRIAITVMDAIEIYEVSSGECLKTLNGHSKIANSVSWSNDGGRICSGGSNKTLRVWDVSTGECIQILDADVCVASWNGDSSRICGGTREGTLRVWDIPSGECIQIFRGHSHVVSSVAWSRDGRICSSSFDHTIRVWKVSSDECIQILKGHSDSVNSAEWSKDGDRICSGSNDQTVKVWDVLSGTCLRTLKGHSSWVSSVSWNGDGTRICSGSYDKTLRVWDISSSDYTLFEGHTSFVMSVSWSSDGRRIASGSYDATVRVWQVENTSKPFQGHSSGVTSVAWSRDGRRICTGSRDQTLRVWDVSTGECIQTLTGHTDAVTSEMWHGDGRRICSGSRDSTVRVWDVSSGECLHVLQGHSRDVKSVAWSNDGSKLCSGGDEGTLRVWEASSGKCLQIFKGHTASVSSVSWNDSGSWICSGSFDGSTRVWEVSSGECIQNFSGHYWVTSVSWNGGRICSGSDDGITRVWKMSSGECVQTLPGHSSVVTSASWSRDGNRICSSDDGTMCVWEVASGECIHVLRQSFFPGTLLFSKLPLPLGFVLGFRTSLCPTNSRLAVAVDHAVVHCLQRCGGTLAHDDA